MARTVVHVRGPDGRRVWINDKPRRRHTNSDFVVDEGNNKFALVKGQKGPAAGPKNVNVVHQTPPMVVELWPPRG